MKLWVIDPKDDESAESRKQHHSHDEIFSSCFTINRSTLMCDFISNSVCLSVLQSNRQPVRLNLLTCQVKPSAEDKKCFDLISCESEMCLQASFKVTADAHAHANGHANASAISELRQPIGCCSLFSMCYHPADNRTYRFQAEDEAEFVR